MFTIKIVKPSGEQQLYEADYVALIPKRPPGSVETVAFRVPGGSEFFVEAGDVFVMSSNGKTVADYHMWHEVEIPPELINKSK
jgi:hypothetical protein